MHRHLIALLGLSVLAAAELPEHWAALRPADEAWKTVEQRFVFNNGSEPESLDPALMTGVLESRLGIALFEGLVGLHPKTLAPVPACAARWELAEDGLTWTFHLYPDLQWSDGTPLTAVDFQASWLRVLDPATAAEYAYQLFPVAGAEAYHTGTGPRDAVGIAVVDPLTLRVTLARPCPYFLDLVAFHTLFPVPLATIAEHGERWTRPEHIVSNGPYRLTVWEPRQRIVMEANPRWHWAEHLILKQVVAHPYEDVETGVKLFQSGSLHWQPAVPSGRVEELQLDPSYYVEPYLGTYFYRFNVERPPFDDPLLRRALCMAIDRTVITDHLLKAGQRPTSALCPPGCAGYQPVEGLPYDREEARRLLAASTYGPGKKPLPPIDLVYNTSEDHKKVAENIAAQWEANLGVRVSLRNLEWKVYLDHMTRRDYQLMRSSWIGDYNDPNTFFDMFVKDGGNNRTNWDDPRYDELIARAATTADHAERLELFREAEQILVVEGCPILPLYIYVNQGLISERVGGWTTNIRDHHSYQYLWLE